MRAGARIAIIGGGPSGIVAAKHAVDAGFEVTVFEASDRLGGQWHTTAPHSGVWPGMRTNTSRAMTAFSDLPAPPEYPLHPRAEQIHAYLEAYAHRFDLARRVRFDARVRSLTPGWSVDGEPFDAVIHATGRFHSPRLPDGLSGFTGEVLHTYDYPGATPFTDRPVLVLGNGISGVEIASDLAPHAPVISAFRKSRYVIRKVVDGVSSDWQWYTQFGALERRRVTEEEWSRRQRARILRVAGDPADFGAPAPDADVRIAGLSLSQDYLAQIRAGDIVCRPAIASAHGRTVTFTDGTTATVEAIVCATGYAPDLPYEGLHTRTFHPRLPGLGVIGQFLAQGPYFPLLELQARWIAAVWSGQAPPPDMRRVAPAPALDAHNALALTLSEELGVAPDPDGFPELADALVFGPMLPPRYRLTGPGALADAPAHFAEQLAASPRAPVDPADREAYVTMERMPHAASARSAHAPTGGGVHARPRTSSLG